MRKIQIKIGLLIAFISGLLMILSGCTINKPEAPSWETTWDLPLTLKTYSIEDIIEEMDTEEIVFDSLGNPSFSITQDVDTISVDDNLTAPGVSQTYVDSIGVVDVDVPDISPAGFSLADLQIPLSLGQVPVDTSFLLDEDLDSLDSFSWAQIGEGAISFEASNDLGIDIDSLTITLFNTSNMSIPLGTAIFENGINDDSTFSRQIDLAGKFVENKLTLRMFGTVNAQTVENPSNDLVITASFPNGLSVTSALMEVPPFTREMNHTVELGDESVIYQAVIETGTITLQIVNGSELSMDINLEIPNFTYSGNSLTVSENITGNSTLNRDFDLAGYTFAPIGTSAPQTISINASANIQDSSPIRYLVNSTDSLRVMASVSDITFASVMGRIQPTGMEIEPMTEEVELPGGFEDFQLTQAELRMILYNNSTTDFYVDLQLSDESGARTIVIADTIQGKASQSDNPMQTTLTVGSLTLSSFLNPTPSEITITGSAILNPANDDSVLITKDDFFYGEVEIYSPLAFALADTIEIDLDFSDVEIDSDDMPDFEETFIYGKISAELESHLPVGARVCLYLSTRGDSTAFNDPDAVIVGPFTLESAVTDSNGFAIGTVASVFEDSLTSTEITIFDNDLLYIAPQIQLLPTGPGGSVNQGSDYIDVTASARLRVKAGEHLFEDDGDN